MAKQIIEKHRECEDAVSALKKSAKELALLRWEVGDLLKQAKEMVDHGEFGKWQEKHLSEIPETTRSRYLALRKRCPSRQDLEKALDDGKCITAIYRDLGIIPPEPTPSKTGPATTSRLTSRLKVACNDIEALRAKIPEWTSEEKEEILEQLRPILMFAADLGLPELDGFKFPDDGEDEGAAPGDQTKHFLPEDAETAQTAATSEIHA